MPSRYILLAICFLGTLIRGQAQPVPSRDDCQNAYNLARSAYDIGDFTKVRELLDPCVTPQRKAGQGIKTRIDALELLALSDIAQDSMDNARNQISKILELDPVFIQTTTLRNVIFEDLLDEIRARDRDSKVSSVTKKPESIRMASANIRLIKRQEIIDRGYIDIVDLLSDLPGFHISRVFGQIHANVYQLGFRQENSERTLLMVDGVEENDLWSNWAYFSRQYPLSNIKAVEVIYGPASVMYGPRAFVGAINIITLDPKDLATDHIMPVKGRDNPYKNMQLHGNVMYGGFNTRDADLTLQFRGREENTKNSKFSMQITGRYYKSDEHDLSHLRFYDYDSADIRHFGYGQLNKINEYNNILGKGFLTYYADTLFRLPNRSPYYNIRRDANGNVLSINLTDSGIARARALDLKSYTGKVNGAPLGFSNTTENMYFGAKIRLEDIQIGFNFWKIREGYGLYQDVNEAGSANGSIWAPMKASMYIKFEKRFERGLSLTNLTNFTMQRLGRETARVNFMSFGDPNTVMHFANLVNPDSLLLDLPTLLGIYAIRNNNIGSVQAGSSGQAVFNYDGVRPGWRNRYMFYQAQQVRNETRFFYEARKWDIAGGLDLRSTQTQGDLLVYQDFLTDYPTSAAFQGKQDSVSLAREKGIVESSNEGGNLFSLFDVGLYSMFNYNLSKSFRMSFGARADYNVLRSSSATFIATPRIAMVYHRPQFSVKFTSGSGYQGVSQATRFSSAFGRRANEDIEPEKIVYADLSIGGGIRARGKAVEGASPFEYDLSGYVCKITNAVGVDSSVRGTTIVFKNANIRQFRIMGAFGSVSWQPSKHFRLDANGTYTLAVQTDSVAARAGRAPRLLVGDIARYMANLSANFILSDNGPVHLSLNLRANYVANRPLGGGTTQYMNFGIDSATRGGIPAYLVFHGNLGLALGRFPRFRLDLTVQNILDRNILDARHREYFHPGAREASGSFNMPWDPVGTPFADRHVPYVPQRGRFIMLQLGINLYSSVKKK
jgi:outer membrane receptor for ferrienterochelin and colicin